MNEQALGLLGLARKGGKLAIGEEPVGVAARDGKARLIILASDAAGHTCRRANSYAALHKTPVVALDADKSRLGGLFGRSSVAMAALTDVRLAQVFLERLGEPERYGPALQAVTEKAETMARRKEKRRSV